jgi:hypothetical protein
MSWTRHPLTVLRQTLGRKSFEQFASHQMLQLIRICFSGGRNIQASIRGSVI